MTQTDFFSEKVLLDSAKASPRPAIVIIFCIEKYFVEFFDEAHQSQTNINPLFLF